MLNRDKLDAFMKVLDNLFPRIHVVDYVRQPELSYISRIRQHVKADHRMPTPHKFCRYFTQPFRLWSKIAEKR